MVINILLALLILLRLVIGIQLFFSARRNHLPNLYWLSAFFITAVIGLPFAPSVGNPLGDLPFSIWIFIGVATLLPIPMLIAFNHTTFYQGRQSPAAGFGIAFFLLSLVTVYGMVVSESNYKQSPWVAAYIPINVALWGWHGWLAYQAWGGVAKEPEVEDWVKTRYQLMAAYSFALIGGAIGSFVRIVFAGGSAESALGNAMGVITLIAQIISVSLQFLVWVMPEAFRRWLNRNYQAHTEARIHAQAWGMMRILGAAMDEAAGQNVAMTSLFAMRTAASKMGGTEAEDEKALNRYLAQLDYRGWEALLQRDDLRRQMETVIGPQKATGALQAARTMLSQKQSLFTMAAK